MRVNENEDRPLWNETAASRFVPIRVIREIRGFLPLRPRRLWRLIGQRDGQRRTTVPPTVERRHLKPRRTDRQAVDSNRKHRRTAGARMVRASDDAVNHGVIFYIASQYDLSRNHDI